MVKKLKTSAKPPSLAPDSIPQTKPEPKLTSKHSEPAVILETKTKKREKITGLVLDEGPEQNQTKSKNAVVSKDFPEVGIGKKRKNDDAASVATGIKKNPHHTSAKSKKSDKELDTAIKPPSIIHFEANDVGGGEGDDNEWHGFDRREKPSLDGGKHAMKSKALIGSGSLVVPTVVKKSNSKEKNQEPDSDVEEDSGNNDDDEEDVHLHGFSSDDQDSSDEDDMIDAALPFDVKKLPTIAKDDKVFKQKLDKASRLLVCLLIVAIMLLLKITID
jgi:nucleolar protein 15